MLKKSFLILFIVLFFSFVAFTQQFFKAKVVGVVDGDTVTVLDKDYRQITIRLAGIDAPEKKQDFGQSAKEFLAKLIFEKKVTILATKKDRYGRTVGKILLDGKDINLAMIEAGLAWHYKEYEDEQTESDRELYSNAEKSSRLKLSGLWIQPNAIKPSDFRKNAKSESAVTTPPLLPSGRRDMPSVITPAEVNSGSSAENSTTSTGSASSSGNGNKTVHVKGYTRKDGTYIPPHTRSAPRKKN